METTQETQTTPEPQQQLTEEQQAAVAALNAPRRLVLFFAGNPEALVIDGPDPLVIWNAKENGHTTFQVSAGFFDPRQVTGAFEADKLPEGDGADEDDEESDDDPSESWKQGGEPNLFTEGL